LLRNVLAGTPARANGRGLSPSGLQPDAFGHLATSRSLAPDHGVEPRTFGFSSGITSLRDMSLRWRAKRAEAAALPVELARLGWWCGWIRTTASSWETALQAAAIGLSATHPLLAPRARFERATSGFVGRRSGPAELTRFCVSGAERGLRSPDARAFNAPLYLLSYLGSLIWRLVRDLNPRLPARQAGTLTAELTKHWWRVDAGRRRRRRVRTCGLPLARRLLYQDLSYTPNESHPVAGSGTAQSSRSISTLEA
jgi:hypothetical protein